MALISWKNSYSVGVKELDEQHKKIFDVINRLNNSMNAPTNTEKLSQILKELIDYSFYHFSNEENYFNQFGYKSRDQHIKMHQFYSKKVSHFIKDYEEKNGYLSFEIISFLINWWDNHINGADKDYTQCFHEHGLY